MDLDIIKESIISFLVNIYILFINNTNIVFLIIIIIVIIILTYLFSKTRRIKSKLNYINNNLKYDEIRTTVDYCGLKNNTQDKLIANIEPLNNGIKILNNEIDLWKYNLSSEFVLEIKGKNNNKYDNLVNKPYNIKNIDPIDSNKLYFTNDTIFPASRSSLNEDNDEQNNLVELIFYRVNSSSNDNPYKYKKLCEYTFSSSYNSFLIGNQLIDYCSLDMIQQVLYLGARYIEIPIYDLEQKNDTIPVLYNTYNGTRLTLNYLEIEKILELLGKMAFNNRLLSNYNDPLFIYLNIKTKNIKTLDKVHDYIIKYLNKYLLSRSYNHINIAFTKLCDIENKCVILSSGGYQNSKLDTIINCSTDKDYLKRITYNEALLNKDEMQGSKFKLNSNKVKFVSSNINDAHTAKSLFKDHIEIVDNNINLFNYGITKGDGLNISGSKNAKNNSGEFMYLIHSITRNKIVFDKSVELTNEEIGSYISLHLFDKDGKGEQLEEYNKNNLTIVIPDYKLSSANYEYKNAMYKGCQFVCMNFQNIDEHMTNYFNLFKKKSILFKPRVLINNITIAKSISINSMTPKKKNNDIVLNIDYNLIDNIRSERYANITPFSNNKLKLIGYGQTFNDTNLRNIKFSMNYTNFNSRFKLIKGLNNQSGYISIKLGDRYLTYRDCCCYLYLTKNPTDDINSSKIDNSIKYKFNNSASFLTLNSPITKKGFNSFGIIKSIKDKDKLYYLKIRSNFNSNRRLFVKKVKEYESKLYLTSQNGTKLVVLKPKFNINGNFFPTGDIVINEDRLLTLNYDQSIKVTTTSNNNVKDTYTRNLDSKQTPELVCKEDNMLINNKCYKPCKLGYKEDPEDKTNCIYEYNDESELKEIDLLTNDNKQCPYGYELDSNKCYKVCDDGYLGNGNICKEDNKIVNKKKLKVQQIIKSDQNFETEIFSGATDHPKDYELIWENKDMIELYDDQEISIWKPIANEGFMEMGNVFVNGYTKPQTNEVVCISVDYLKEESIYSNDENFDFGNPIFYNTKSQLALWNITPHDYVKAFPYVKLENNDNDTGSVAIPNSIEFKMYDFIIDEKDYYDKLYLDSNISSNLEKEATLFKINFDSIIKTNSNDIYDYLMKLENSNGKLISYTPSDNGNKMCMSLPQPYWSSFYQDVTSNIEKKPIDSNINKPKINFESCKSRDYFGTNWNYYDVDNTIRLEGNKDACLTYNGNPKSKISVDINDSNNYLYLDKCNPDSNQKFVILNNDENKNQNIKVLTNTEYDPNACLTHSPEDGLRLEECGDKKFTVVSKWMDQIATVDKCSKIDAEKEMEQIGAIELCNNLSYYIIYLSDGFKHRHEEYCSYEDAKEMYEKVKNKYKRGIAIIYGEKILKKKRLSSNEDNIFKNYAKKLINMVGDCVKCKKPSKILCVENSIIQSDHTHFENDTEKKSISEYCRKLKNEQNFKCSRGFRQQFMNNLTPNDFCINYNKEVFIYIYSNEQYPNLGLDVSRVSQNDKRILNSRIQTVDNLLGESYDSNYHIFLKGICTNIENNPNKFRIVFDKDKVKGLSLNYVDLHKFSNDIILNYIPKYNNLKIGSKVLAKLTYQENDALMNKTNIDYDVLGFRANNKISINSSEIRFMGVVINKLNNNQVEIMFSINSYESNAKNKNIANNKNRPFSLSNIRKIYNVNDLVLLKKAPLCL